MTGPIETWTLDPRPDLIPLRDRPSNTFGSVATEVVVWFLVGHGILVDGRPTIHDDGSVTVRAIGDPTVPWSEFVLPERHRR